ncbi:MAG: DUF2065 domain-containing protein [Ancalomicrobiaceae bacterium]|nr:DUF2065 domain-containing protein [Ancalomicrobiaceae bacterium]
MKDLVTALGLMLALEGALYAAAPSAMKKLMREVMNQPEGIVRWFGFAALVAGVGVVWAIRG